MSILSISFDTKEKKSTVSLDGQPLSNIESVSLYRYAWETDEGGKEVEKEISSIEVVMREIVEDEKMSKKTCLYASEIKDGNGSMSQLEDYARAKSENISKLASNWLTNYGK